jgi:hypothetical protein
MPLLLLELLGDPVHHALVEVVTAEMRVAVGGLHLEDALADLEDRDVEGAAAEVVDRDRLVLLLVEAVGERGRRGLVDDAQHLEAGDLAGVLGRLALAVVEVRGDRDDGLRDLLAQIGLGGLLQLAAGSWRRSRAASTACRESRRARPVGRLDDLVRDELDLLQHLVVRRPMNRLMENTVFSGFVMACRFATWPTRISPSFVKPTTEGVSRLPSWFAITVGLPPSTTATTEFVVPRSIADDFCHNP